ncbi:MAG: redox-regulated ATPase YchF [Spirochaetaceae bacterium]|nr:MAG: redox-regulated ATPase YchF [Spirochaetaceae bacterium]
MNIGIIGLPKAGKTTIFNALTGQEAEVAEYASGRIEPNVAVVDVGDPRVDTLSAMYQPKKTIYATTEFIDFVGGAGAGGSSPEDGAGSPRHKKTASIFSGEGITMVRNADALLLVLRNFSNPTLDETYGTPGPSRDLDTIETELILADQVIAERRLERIQADHQRGRKTPASQAEEKVMHRVVEQLDGSGVVRDLDLTTEEKQILSGFRFLTAKPVLLVLNSSEENYGKNGELLRNLEERYPAIEFAGNFEMELSRMEQEDAEAFMEDMGITESARNRLTRFAYRMLGYISFFTVGEDEVRAWTIRDGENAQAAAGTIHSDLAKGFIRAECFSYEDLVGTGSEAAVKQKGLFRLEGKEYPVKDGDILNIRFNV